MGYKELRNQVVLSAVNDYKRMIKICKERKIKDPKSFMRKHVYDAGFYSIYNIIRWGLDAEEFFNNKEALLIYTEIDGQKIMEHIRETA